MLRRCVFLIFLFISSMAFAESNLSLWNKKWGTYKSIEGSFNGNPSACRFDEVILFRGILDLNNYYMKPDRNGSFDKVTLSDDTRYGGIIHEFSKIDKGPNKFPVYTYKPNSDLPPVYTSQFVEETIFNKNELKFTSKGEYTFLRESFPNKNGTSYNEVTIKFNNQGQLILTIKEQDDYMDKKLSIQTCIYTQTGKIN